MQSSHTSLARSRAYTLFGRLYLEGPGPAGLPALRAVPELAEALTEPFDAEAAAADHYELFHLNVFPYASLFLDAEGQLGGPATDAARHLLRQAGYPADTTRESADHVGHALGLLAFLAGAEADAWADHRADEAARMQHHQRRFFDAYLLWWLPPFVEAVRHHHPFYTALADLTLDLALDHRAALGPATDTPALLLPDPPALLDDPKSGLKDIAAYLTTPAWSGLYLSRTALGRLGRAERLPRGFGARVLMLTNLLRAAVDYDRLAPLLAQLHHLAETSKTFYTALLKRGVPGLDAAAKAWLARLDTTTHMLDRLRVAKADFGS